MNPSDPLDRIIDALREILREGDPLSDGGPLIDTALPPAPPEGDAQALVEARKLDAYPGCAE